MKATKKSSGNTTCTFEIDLANGVKVSKANIKIYGLSAKEPVLLSSKTDASSNATLTYSVNHFEYCLALVTIESIKDAKVPGRAKRHLSLLSVFQSSEDKVVINEPVSIACIYVYSRFINFEGTQLKIAGSAKQLLALFKMKNNFVTSSGEISHVIKRGPNGLQTNSLAVLNFLANTLHQTIVKNTVYQGFLKLTATNKSTGSTLQAVHALAQHPFRKVQEIYRLTNQMEQFFLPSLTTLQLPHHVSRIPDQWTLAIKVNDSGAKNFVIAGVGFIAFDEDNKAWITNNVRAGTPNSSTFCTVLDSDGSPASFSPLFGGGLLGGGFGVTTNLAKNRIYLGNFGWGPTQCNPQEGSVSEFTKDGTAVSPSSGYVNKVSRAQGMQVDSMGNLWVCSWGSQAPLAPSPNTIYNYKSKNSGIVVYLKGDPENSLLFEFENPYYQCLDLVIDEEDNVMIANGGLKSKNVKSCVFKFRLIDGEIKRIGIWESNYIDTKDPTDNGYESLKQITVDQSGEILIAAMKSNRIIHLDRDLKFVKEYKHLIDAPWGVCTDENDTIFVANFGREEASREGSASLDMRKKFGVTIIKDSNEETAQFMTLPTGGEEVLSANGAPLYGNNLNKHGVHYKCYQPLMRMTATLPDAIGNLWCMNNWKPSAKVDTSENPGGDGVVIFIGVSAPRH